MDNPTREAERRAIRLELCEEVEREAHRMLTEDGGLSGVAYWAAFDKIHMQVAAESAAHDTQGENNQ
jgi:hypothetical protein